VGGGVGSQLPLVAGDPERLALAHHDGTDWHVVVLGSALGLAKRQSHEVLVTAEEPLFCVHRGKKYQATSRAQACYSFTMHGPSMRPCQGLAPILILGGLIAATSIPGAPGPAAASGAHFGAQVASGAHFGAQVAPRPYARGEVLVRYAGHPGEHVVKLPERVGVSEAVRSLRESPGVVYANPNYLVHAATTCPGPNDPGRSGSCGGWREDQWNFLADTEGGVEAHGAWANVHDANHSGGRGVTVAVLDTGVAYRRRGRRFSHDPDLPGARRFVSPKDYIDDDPLPLDLDGHGTHVASTIAQRTGNNLGLTGLAYGVKLMPIRVLNRNEKGEGSNVARGISFATRHDADVINLSLEFGPRITSCTEIQGVCDALKHAIGEGVTVVAAAGNGDGSQVAYPAAAPGVIAAGGTTIRGCLADYSDYGTKLNLVAPGGGRDAAMVTGEADCAGRSGPPVRQYGLKPDAAASGDFRKFGFVGLEGTSMSAAHVSAAAALVIASGVAGIDPAPDAVASRLACTATDRGAAGRDLFYGSGLLNAARATDPTVTCPG
jgi:serine protease